MGDTNRFRYSRRWVLDGKNQPTQIGCSTQTISIDPQTHRTIVVREVRVAIALDASTITRPSERIKGQVTPDLLREIHNGDGLPRF